MKQLENKNDWINRYVAAVGRRLTRPIRNDVESELRSSLQDMLEDRGRELNRAPDEELTLEILQELDPPDRMASRYIRSQYLVGPRLYPTFTLIIKILLLVLVAKHVLGFLAAFSELSSGNFLDMIGKSIGVLAVSAFGSIGALVVVFAILEQVVLKSDETFETGWDPRTLPAVRSPNTVRTTGSVVNIVFTMAVMVLINFYPEWVGVTYYGEGGWHHVTALTPAFSAYVLPINILALLNILLQVVLLRQGVWTLMTRWLNLGLNLFGIAILVAMIKGPPVAYLSPEQMPPIGGDQAFDMKPLLILILIWRIYETVRRMIQQGLYIQIPIPKWSQRP